MIFFSHSSRIRILQLTFALVCSCSEGLLTTEKYHLVPFCLLIFCILCLRIQIKYFFFLATQGTELKSAFHLLRLFTDRTDPLFRFLIRSYIPTCLYRQFVITQTEFSQSYPVLDVGDLTEIIFTFIIFYCFKFLEGSQFVLLVGLFSYVIVYVT